MNTQKTKSKSIGLLQHTVLASAIAATSAWSLSAQAEDFAQALSGGKAYGDFLLRYETVEQDNVLKDASGLTLRSMFGYTTAAFHGFTATLEAEDSRTVLGKEDYDYHPLARPSGYTVRGYSVIADAPHTELDQAFVQYKADKFTFTGGRQVITMDNHRFVGHVGWRQDRQTFDGVKLDLTPMAGMTATYAYLAQRNRIFSELADQQSKDHLLNVGYTTSLGKVTAYGYFLEEDNVAETTYDTLGLRFAGKSKSSDTLSLIYALEYAMQDYEAAAVKNDADYMLAELGVDVSGFELLLGYESLGSDENTYGFQTPLATLHKFNGWADMFLVTPNQGLTDTYVSFGTSVAGAKVEVAYHTYDAEDGTAGVEDFGSEINVLIAKKFGKNYNAGLKYAAYSAGDINVDTDKMWVWVGASF